MMKKMQVQNNLKKSKEFTAKLDYLYFVYKDRVIVGLLTLLLVGGLLFSYVAKKNIVLSVRVLSHEKSYENVAVSLKESLAAELEITTDEIIDVAEFNISDQKNQDAFVAQLVAKEIDVIFLSDEIDKKMAKLFDENGIEKGDMAYQDDYGRWFVSRIPTAPPHKLSLEKMEQLYEKKEQKQW